MQDIAKCSVHIGRDLVPGFQMRHSPSQSHMGLKGRAGLQPTLPSPERLGRWKEGSRGPTVSAILEQSEEGELVCAEAAQKYVHAKLTLSPVAG